MTAWIFSRRKRGCFLAISLLFLFFLFPFPANSAWGATRAETLDVILSALDLPYIGGTLPPDVSQDHPLSKALESAAALKIIPSDTPFYPDQEATPSLAVTLSLNAMGWGHEASLLSSFEPSSADASLRIVREMKPSMPSLLETSGDVPLTSGDLEILRLWLRDCRKQCQWEHLFKGEGVDLLVHREGVGRPASAHWTVQIALEEDAEAAQQVVSTLQKEGTPAHVVLTDGGYSIETGDFPTSFDALKEIDGHPEWKKATVVSHGNESSPALFWAALISDPVAVRPQPVLAASLGRARLPLSSFVASAPQEVLGAINGGYFSGDHLIGTLCIDHIPSGNPYKGRSAIGIKPDGTIVFGNGWMRAGLRIKGKLREITDFNAPCDANGLSLYSPAFGERATKVPLDAVEFLFAEGKILSVREAASSPHDIPANGLLFIARGESRRFFADVQSGDEARLVVDWQNPTLAECPDVLQAGPLLLFEGKPVSNTESFSPGLLRDRHPRTVIGTDGTRLWWIVIDGRNSWHSRGASLEEVKRLAMKLGLISALNLDGGGSSTLWWKGRLVNLPSDGSERPLPYAILLVPRNVSGNETEISLSGTEKGIPAASKASLMDKR